MARKKSKGREEDPKGTQQPTTGKEESALPAAKKIPKDEMVAFRVTQEMISQARKFIQDHGSVRSPLAAMLEADAGALSGDLDDFMFYARVSMLCVIHVMLGSEDTSIEHVRWEDVI